MYSINYLECLNETENIDFQLKQLLKDFEEKFIEERYFLEMKISDTYLRTYCLKIKPKLINKVNYETNIFVEVCRETKNILAIRIVIKEIKYIKEKALEAELSNSEIDTRKSPFNFKLDFNKLLTSCSYNESTALKNENEFIEHVRATLDVLEFNLKDFKDTKSINLDVKEYLNYEKNRLENLFNHVSLKKENDFHLNIDKLDSNFIYLLDGIVKRYNEIA